MKTTIKHLAFFSSFLFAIVIVFSSFAPVKKNSHATGSGSADGIKFSFNVKGLNDDAATGFIEYGNNNYIVDHASWFGKSVILFTTDGHVFYVCDNGKPSAQDWISDPILSEYGQLLSPSDFYWMHCVTNGNIQVKE
jgi:hypothetical protein